MSAAARRTSRPRPFTALRFLAFLVVLASTASAAGLPGFRLEKVVLPGGFVTSIAFNSVDELHYTITKGKVYKVQAGANVQIASVNTASEGNAALLGMTFRGTDQIVLHYVSSDLTAQMLTILNAATGETITTHRIPCSDLGPCSTEHHGGNPITAPGGVIFFGIGDFGASHHAQDDGSPGGKIFRMLPGEMPAVFAKGFRNPFDFAFNPADGKLIVGDNGAQGQDEISLIGEGDNGGWPLTMGTETPVEGTVAPIFTFAETVAPTGMVLLDGKGTLPAGGLLLGSFVTKALYYFPDIWRRPLPPPIEILRGEAGPVIDVAQNSAGEIFLGTGGGIYKLQFPKPGDADGNGRIDAADLEAISREILDGDGNEKLRAHEGTFRGSWGADVNLDGIIDARDLVALAWTRSPRSRSARP